jgi:hypothetical protein
MLHPSSPEIVTCYHEAAHAYVAHLFNLPLHSVSVVPDGETLGRMRPTPDAKYEAFAAKLPEKLDDFPPDDSLTIELCVRLMTGSVVGPLIERRLFGGLHIEWGGDLRDAIRTGVRLLGRDYLAITRAIRQAIARASEIIADDDHLARIDLLSRTLTRKKELSGIQVRQILGKATGAVQ